MWDVSFKMILASVIVFELGIVITIFDLGTVITLFVLRCMLNYLCTYVTCGLYVESCTILVICWIIRDPS